MANKVKVCITTLDGEVLELFEVVGGNVREKQAELVPPVEIAEQIREHVSFRFELSDD